MHSIVSHTVALLMLVFGSGYIFAQGAPKPDDFPNRTVKIIVPYGAGGSADLLARVIGRQLSIYWKQPVVIENVPGGSGSVGIERLVRSEPDGYTLGNVPVSNLVVNPHLYSNLRFDTFKDLAPISRTAEVQNILVTGRLTKINDIKDLIASAKAKPGSLSFASFGVGAQAHIAGELFNVTFGLQTIHVPYNRPSAAVSDVVSGHVTYIFAQAAAVRSLIQSGELNALAIASNQRSEYFPSVPTVEELTGAKGFDTVAWSALMAPAKTPSSIRNFIASDVRRALAEPSVREALENLSAEPAGSTPAALAEFMQQETKRYEGLVKKLGIRIE
jgi:tripartite-type tricarboxylate transporter receptor subunit TctC